MHNEKLFAAIALLLLVIGILPTMVGGIASLIGVIIVTAIGLKEPDHHERSESDTEGE